MRAGRELDDSTPGRLEHAAPAAPTHGSSTSLLVPRLGLRLLRLLLCSLLKPEELQPRTLRLQNAEFASDGPRLGRVIRLVMRHVDTIHEHRLERVQHVGPKAARRTARARTGKRRGGGGGAMRGARTRCRAARRTRTRRRIVKRRRRRSVLERRLLCAVLFLLAPHVPRVHVRFGLVHRGRRPAEKPPHGQTSAPARGRLRRPLARVAPNLRRDGSPRARETRTRPRAGAAANHDKLGAAARGLRVGAQFAQGPAVRTGRHGVTNGPTHVAEDIVARQAGRQWVQTSPSALVAIHSAKLGGSLLAPVAVVAEALVPLLEHKAGPLPVVTRRRAERRGGAAPRNPSPPPLHLIGERAPDAIVAGQTEHHAVETLDVQVAPEAHLADRVRAPVVRVVPDHIHASCAAVTIAPVRPGPIPPFRNVVQKQALATRVPAALRGRAVRVQDTGLIGQNQILPGAQTPEDEGAGRVLPCRVPVDGRLVLVEEAEPTHLAMLRHVALGELPARGPAAVQVAPDDALPLVPRKASLPVPRLRQRVVREVHLRGVVPARTVGRLAAVLGLNG